MERRYVVPISGFLVVETDTGEDVDRRVAQWLFSVLRRGGEVVYDKENLFSSAEPPMDIIIRVDHNHIGPCITEKYQEIIDEARTYEKKKLAAHLPKKQRDSVINAENE